MSKKYLNSLCELLYRKLKDLVPQEKPALLHGDLWQGNLIHDESSNPVLIDPAVYYGHREMDLSMLELFGNISESTMDAYQQVFPLEKHWEERKDVHQLYPLLVHLLLSIVVLEWKSKILFKLAHIALSILILQ